MLSKSICVIADFITLNSSIKFKKNMDLTHLHLMINHFPIIGTLIGTLLMAYALFSKQAHLQKVILAT